jgi:amidase
VKAFGLMYSSAGCSGLVGARPKFEATAVEKLRSAGAIILGKSNCSEWGNFRAPEKSISGWSAVGGQCLGIYAKDQSPSGSSSGSAVATSLGLAAAALGTEVREALFLSILTQYLNVKLCHVTEISKTTGSISSPANASGVVGLKPTVGLTSRHGVYCVTEWEDSVGVLGRTVLDAATILTSIAGK